MDPVKILPTLSSALAILTSMITPALLISASGTFILSTSNRLGRVVDRARRLSEHMEELIHSEHHPELFEEQRRGLFAQMELQAQRARLLVRSLTVLYIAAGMFVATSVAIGLVSLFSFRWVWLPVVLGIAGACFLFWGTIILIFEARIAMTNLRVEMDLLSLIANHHIKAKMRSQLS